jgi:hypothetical protein
MASVFDQFLRPDQANTAGSAFEPTTPQQQLLNYNTLIGRDAAWQSAEGSPWKSPEPGWFAKLMSHPGTQGLLNAANFIGPGPKLPGRAMAPSGKGGGELPMDLASRMARAQQMGFDTNTRYYHGTGRHFDEFKPNADKVTGGGLNDRGVFLSPEPSTGSRYARDFGGDSPSVLPLYTRVEKPLSLDAKTFEKVQKIADKARRGEPLGEIESIFLQDDLAKFGIDWDGASHPVDAIQRAGFDAIDKGKGRFGLAEAERMVFDPAKIRSVNADFDPVKRGSANLMASHLAPVLGAGAALGAFTRNTPSEE